jgi:hypothetical protein
VQAAIAFLINLALDETTQAVRADLDRNVMLASRAGLIFDTWVKSS